MRQVLFVGEGRDENCKQNFGMKTKEDVTRETYEYMREYY
jgi:hypothetical protein